MLYCWLLAISLIMREDRRPGTERCYRDGGGGESESAGPDKDEDSRRYQGFHDWYAVLDVADSALRG